MTPSRLSRSPRLSHSSPVARAMGAAMAVLLAGTAVAQSVAPTASPSASSASSAASASATPAAPAIEVRIDVQAPGSDDLASLLGQHLDLARLSRLAPDEAPDDIELLRLIGAAPAQARELLQTEGYFDAEVSVQRASRSAGSTPLITVRVRPGPRVVVGRVELLAEGELDRQADAGDAQALLLLADLRAQWSLPAGQPFRNERWGDAKAALLQRLRAAGYASAAASGSTALIDVPNRSARLVVVVDSGPLFRAGPIEVEGLALHEAVVVQRLSGLAPGTPLTESRLLDFQERLQKLGLFDSALVRYDPDPAQAAATPVLVRVRERSRQQATVGLGVSANTGPRISLEHMHRQPFGQPATLRNKIEWGRDRRVWEGEFAGLPNEHFDRNLLGTQYDRLVDSTGTVTSERLRLGRTRDTTRFERLVFAEFDRSVQLATGFERDARAVGGHVHLLWRELDSVLLPTRGWSLSLQAGGGQARSPQAETGPFGRLYARGTGYWPLGEQWYGQARVELGQVFKRDSVLVPDALAFRAGGDDSVRGYAYRSLAPTINGITVAGAVLGTASIELARPISPRLPSVWGAVFIDAGRAADHWRTLKPATGLGVGVRWRSPVGPLKMDVAWGEETRKLRLHLSVGIAF